MEPVWIGTAGVTLLLAAFTLNLARLLTERSSPYLLMNLFGAGLSAWYAWEVQSIPFVILEGVWASAALIRLAMGNKKALG